MRDKILLALFLLLVFFGMAFSQTQHFCKLSGPPPSGHCSAINTTRCKYFSTACVNFTTSAKCNSACQSLGGTRVESGCKWVGSSCIGYTPYDPPGRCVTASQGTSCAASTCSTMPCQDVPEFFGVEFGEMSLSSGIIALVAAIVLPMVLFRRHNA